MYRGHGDDVTGDLCRDLPGSSPTSRLAESGSRCRSLEAATPAYICATHISSMLPYPNISLVYRATTVLLKKQIFMKMSISGEHYFKQTFFFQCSDLKPKHLGIHRIHHNLLHHLKLKHL